MIFHILNIEYHIYRVYHILHINCQTISYIKNKYQTPRTISYIIYDRKYIVHIHTHTHIYIYIKYWISNIWYVIYHSTMYQNHESTKGQQSMALLHLPDLLCRPLEDHGLFSQKWGVGKRTVIWSVVGPPLWKIWKSIGMIIPNIWENKKCSKPPTSYNVEWDWYNLVLQYNYTV